MERPALLRWILPIAAAMLAVQTAFAAQQSAGRARALYDTALRLQHDGNAAGALALLWEAAGLAPADGDIQNELGRALERIGALDAAAAAYRAAADAPHAPPGAARNLVLALVKAGRSSEAIARARTGVEQSPGAADRWFTLGLAQSDVDVDGAIDSFHHALALDARHGLAQYNLALVLYRADRVQPALDALHSALAIQPRPEIYYTLGTIYWHQGDLDRAVSALTEATTASPDYAEALLALGTILEARGHVKGATSALERAIRLRPDLAAPHIVLARALAASGDEAGARRESAEAERLRTLSENLQKAAALTAAGVQKLDGGDASGAGQCFRQAIEAFEPFAPAHYQLGRALDRLGRPDAARAEFARAQQLNPALVPPR
jgi:tetratricopeptide (TPR) repeat protein